MTMRLSIKNEDASRVAVAIVEDFTMGNPTPRVTETATIEPGATHVLYVHASRRIVLTEDANAVRPATTHGGAGPSNETLHG